MKSKKNLIHMHWYSQFGYFGYENTCTHENERTKEGRKRKRKKITKLAEVSTKQAGSTPRGNLFSGLLGSMREEKREVSHT